MSESENPQSPSTHQHTGAVQEPEDLRTLSALVRTAFSSEQTLMSWVRTSVSLFTFGFSITQFFYYLERQQEGIPLSPGPRRLGIALICVGILALVLGMVEHVQRLKRMQEHGLPKIKRFLLPLGSAAAFLAIGICALVITFFNWSL
jgi:putative membrane protein